MFPLLDKAIAQVRPEDLSSNHPSLVSPIVDQFTFPFDIPPMFPIGVKSCRSHNNVSPPNPALAAILPSLLVTIWCTPKGCILAKECTRGWSGEAMSQSFTLESPEADKTYFGLTASVKISDGCASQGLVSERPE